MKMNSLVLGIFAAMILAVGIVSALPAGATITDVSDNGAYDTSTADTTEVTAGHIYVKNLSATQNTLKWAAIYGNITGGFVLADSDGNSAGNRVYQWSVSSPSGYVLATTNTAPTWASLAGATGGDIDTAWSFSASDTDSGTNTFTGTPSSDYTISGVSITAGSNMQVKTIKYDGSSETDYWETDVLKDTGTVSSKDDVLLNGYIHDDGTSYENTNADFQILVPVSAGTAGAPGTETYSVFVELD